MTHEKILLQTSIPHAICLGLEILSFWGTGTDAIPHSPLRPRRRPLRRDGFCNACDHSLPCLLGVGGVPLRPGALPFFNVLMAASTSSEGEGQVKLGERWALCNFVVDGEIGEEVNRTVVVEIR